jgi:hypothetical protein
MCRAEDRGATFESEGPVLILHCKHSLETIRDVAGLRSARSNVPWMMNLVAHGQDCPCYWY